MLKHLNTPFFSHFLTEFKNIDTLLTEGFEFWAFVKKKI